MSAAEELAQLKSVSAGVECIAFVADNQTHGVVASVLDEVYNDAQVRDGGTAQVIEYLSENPPPGVLIVDISEAASPLTAIMSLTAALSEETRIIGIGEVNDIGLYREIIDSGATDYVIKPVTEKALSAAIQRTNEPVNTPGAVAVEQNQLRVAVIGARGGVGVSTVATNLAWIFGEEMHQKTTLLDLDLEFGTIALSLDLEPTRGLREALENPTRIDSLFISSATAKLTDNLSVMATEETLTGEIEFNPNAIDILFETLGRSTDNIIIDLPRPAFGLRQAVMHAATHIVLVTELTLPGLRDSIRLLSNAEDVAKDTPVIVIANRIAGPDQAMPVSEFQKALGRKITLQIPDDPKPLNKAANNGKPLLQQDKRCKAAKAIEKLAKQLAGTDAGKPAKDKGKDKGAKKSKGGGLKGLFKGK